MKPTVNGDRPLVIVAGGDNLATTIAARLGESYECDVRAYWNADPADPSSLAASGVASAAVLMAVGEDDQTNLEIAVQARRLNPNLRVVLRQFKRALAKKIESNLENCSVVSLSSHSAATYAAVAMDPFAFLGLQFPQDDGPLFAFSRRRAADLDVGRMTVRDAERRTGIRILSLQSEPVSADVQLDDEDQLVVFGKIEALSRKIIARTKFDFIHDLVEALKMLLSEIDPLIRALLLGGALIFAVATLFFYRAIPHLTAMSAAYFVMTTMTTTGYGDISLASSAPYIQFAGMILMLFSVAILNLTFAFFAAAVIRAQWGMMQGFRSIKERGHIVVVGCGRIGMRVVDYLLKAGVKVVVVDHKPDDAVLRLARARKIRLLAGDGRQDEALDACCIEDAHSIVAATDEDTHNLEIALGARARQANIPAIVRITSSRFAESVADAFNIRRTYSPTALAAPAFCDLAFRPQARARLNIGEVSYAIEEAVADPESNSDDVVLATSGEVSLVMRRRSPAPGAHAARARAEDLLSAVRPG